MNTAAIGGIPPLKGPFVLAPLAGVTDSVFRGICASYGASLCYTEMVSAKGLYYGNENTEDLLRIGENEGPAGIQIFGSEPEMLSFAANLLKDRPNVLIDINMGCPVPKIVKNGEGSALFRKPDLARKLVEATVAAAGKPVSVKMRIGFNGGPGEPDPVDFALALQDGGAAAVAVHGRTREQFYSGKADWGAIKRIKSALSIPVIGNGDVFSGEDAVRMLDETGCDLVMIARGAMGNPWIFREATELLEGRPVTKPDIEERAAVMLRHVEREAAVKSDYVAVREMRKHVSWYTKGIKGAAELRRRANTAGSVAELMDIVNKIKEIKQ